MSDIAYIQVGNHWDYFAQFGVSTFVDTIILSHNLYI